MGDHSQNLQIKDLWVPALPQGHSSHTGTCGFKSSFCLLQRRIWGMHHFQVNADISSNKDSYLLWKERKKMGDILKYLTGWSGTNEIFHFLLFGWFFSLQVKQFRFLPSLKLQHFPTFPSKFQKMDFSLWSSGDSSHLISDPCNRQNIFEFKPPEVTYSSELFHISAVHKDESHVGGLISPADHEGWWAEDAFPCQFSVFGDVNPILDAALFPHLRVILKASIKPFHNPLSLLWYQDTLENRQIGNQLF